jgi:UDP-N-acetyl-D-glucosamine dehydrogenase
MDGFKALGADVSYHDPHIPEIGATREHMAWFGFKSVPWSHQAIASFDCIVISTNHQATNLSELANWASLIVDTRNAFNKILLNKGKYIKA